MRAIQVLSLVRSIRDERKRDSPPLFGGKASKEEMVLLSIKPLIHNLASGLTLMIKAFS
jgi:hypothetical protein